MHRALYACEIRSRHAEYFWRLISYLHEGVFASEMWGKLKMVGNARIHSALQRLERKVENLELSQAVALIDEEIANPENADCVPHFEVHKASVLRYAGKLQEAAQLLLRITEQYPLVDSAHFFAGQYLVELGQYRQALHYLTNCIDIGVASGENWYTDSAYLLRAYCAAKTGEVALAHSDLEQIADDEEMSWLSVEPAVSKVSIRTMLRVK